MKWKEDEKKMYVITADYRGMQIRRAAFSDFQAWTIINALAADGCTNIGMREEDAAEWKSST